MIDKIPPKTITDQEMLDLITKVASEYTGICGNLTSAIGILVLSRLYGWKVMRLVSSKRQWKMANDNFGDIKKLTPPRGEYARKSLGLAISDKIGSYWKYVRGLRVGTPEEMAVDRKIIINDTE
ncbi:MAG: hypothetical protein PHN45_06135 [Methylococcales bacterium]|nr:hypothetical protein [Methylococcales bacterium]